MLPARFVCGLRLHAPVLAFAAAFSVILARSVVLAAASETDGLPGHISGLVQFFLFVALFGVQCGMSAQELLLFRPIVHSESFIWH